MPRVRDHAPGDLFIEKIHDDAGCFLKLLASVHDQAVCIYVCSIDLGAVVKQLWRKSVIYGEKVCDG